MHDFPFIPRISYLVLISLTNNVSTIDVFSHAGAVIILRHSCYSETSNTHRRLKTQSFGPEVFYQPWRSNSSDPVNYSTNLKQIVVTHSGRDKLMVNTVNIKMMFCTAALCTFLFSGSCCSVASVEELQSEAQCSCNALWQWYIRQSGRSGTGERSHTASVPACRRQCIRHGWSRSSWQATIPSIPVGENNKGYSLIAWNTWEVYDALNTCQPIGQILYHCTFHNGP